MAGGTNDRKRKTTIAGDSTPKKTPRCSTLRNADENQATITCRIHPQKPPNDVSDCRVIKLSTGLTALLISRTGSSIPQNKPKGRGPAFDFEYFLESNMGNDSAYYMYPEESYYLQPTSDYTHGDLTLLRGSPKKSANAVNWKPSTSVAVAVNVGSLGDPITRQGLAHFTEHSVHLGSVKFPAEDDIKKITRNFGYSNASTSPVVTAYYHKVPDAVLEDSLERFSEMLTNPLFEPDALKREVNAVENEWYYRLSHCRRKRYLITSICLKDEKHPLGKFTCGNVATLMENGQVAKLKADMHAFFNEHYVSSAMTLCISSTKSLNELEELTRRHFSKLRQANHGRLVELEQKVTKTGILSELQNMQDKYTYLQGSTRLAELSLTWILPAYISLKAKNEKVIEILKSLFGDTSENGLGNFLCQQGLISWMLVTHGVNYYKAYIQMNFFLTKKGTAKTEKIIQDTFRFIATLQKAPVGRLRQVFDEVRAANLRKFRHSSPSYSAEETLEAAVQLQSSANLDQVLVEDSWEDATFSFENISAALNLLKRENLVIVETIPKASPLKKIETRNIKVVPYSNGARYVTVTRKVMPPPISSERANKFDLPPENRFLIKALEYAKSKCGMGGGGDASDHGERMELPTPKVCRPIKRQRLTWNSKLDTSSISKIYGMHMGHCQSADFTYWGIAALKFVSPINDCKTERNTSLQELWTVLIMRKMQQHYYEFKLGGYSYNISRNSDGIVALIRGFPEHLKEVTDTVMAAMWQTEFTEDEFLVAKEFLLVQLEMILPRMAPDSIVESTIFMEPSVDILDTLEDLSFSDMKNFIQAYRKSTFCLIRLKGNIRVKMFEEIAATLDDMEFAPFLVSDSCSFFYQLTFTKPSICTPGEKCIRVRDVSSDSLTTSVTNVYFLGHLDSGENSSRCFEMGIEFIGKEATFHLRTQLQLGYVVHARRLNFHGMRAPLMMFSVTITATAKKFSACELDKRIDEFLAQYGGILKNMDVDIFNRMRDMIGAEDDLTREKVGDWFQSKFSGNFSEDNKYLKWNLRGIRKHSVQVLSGCPEAETKTCGCNKCSSIVAWKGSPNCKSRLEYAQGGGEMSDYFVTSDNI